MRQPLSCPTCLEPEPVTGGYFVSAYPPFDLWTREQLPAFREALERPPGEPGSLGLYVHIPFCEQRCDYCYYLSYEDRSASEIDDYLQALPGELGQYTGAPALAGRPFDFVYFGGGTPSLLSRDRLSSLFAALTAVMPAGGRREITFECAPRSVTRAKLELLREFGVTRISMGVQQLDDQVLQLNRRPHLVADVERALDDIGSVGFDILNLDLIVGMVGETDRTFFDSLERLLSIGPESITVYQLEIPHNTPLFRDVDQNSVRAELPTWPEKRRRLLAAYERLEEAGYAQRSAYTASRNKENSFVYQDEQYRGADVVGIGASSFSYIGGVHQQNAASLTGYLAAAGPEDLPLSRAYALSREERFVREWILQLKLGRTERAYFRSKFDLDPWARFDRQLSELARDGWIVCDEESLRLTREGLARVDRFLQRFFLPAHRVARFAPPD
jgi:oxygen-independent coproporphyrinogen-3 oxidase